MAHETGAALLRIGDESFVAAFVQVCTFTCGQAVPFRQHQVQRVVLQQGAFQARRRCAAIAYEADIQFPGQQGCELVGGIHLAQSQGHAGIGRPIASQLFAQRRDQQAAGGKAHAQFTLLATRDPLQFIPQCRTGGENLTSALQQMFAGLREAHVALRAHEQTQAQLRLQRLDLLGEWWLADVQPCSRTREVQFLGHGDEITQMAQFHKSVSDISWSGNIY